MINQPMSRKDMENEISNLREMNKVLTEKSDDMSNKDKEKKNRKAFKDFIAMKKNDWLELTNADRNKLLYHLLKGLVDEVDEEIPE